jgi:hypothetical protein
MKHTLILSVFATAVLFSQQQGAPVGVVQFPNETPTLFLDNTGGSGGTSLAFECIASPINNNGSATNYSYSLNVTAGTLTSIVVSSHIATVTTVNPHGLMNGQSVVVTGSTTVSLNGTWTINPNNGVTSTTVFTMSTPNTANGTYNNGALTIGNPVGGVPLLTSPIWSVKQVTYDSNGNLNGTQCANGNCVAMNNICANRTTLIYK